MIFLILGDISGESGRNVIEKNLPNIKKQYNIDFIVANIENITNGKSIANKDYQWTESQGFNFLTSGNHILDHKDAVNLLNSKPNLIRPINLGPHFPGFGTKIVEFQNKKIRITNVMGKTFMQKSDNPFTPLEELVSKDNSDIHILDIHAETTSEKISIGMHFDGQIQIMFGTHTHVQTSDERLLPKGSAFITDVGMNGAYNSVLGLNPDEVIALQRTNIPHRFKILKEVGQFSAIVVEIDNNTNKPKWIKRIFISPDTNNSKICL